MVVTVESVLAICAGFSAICVAVGWLIKIIKAVKKPADDIQAKLDNDNRRIKTLEEDMDFLKKSIPLLMRCDLVILGHLRTDNNTGQMVDMESEIQEFLISR